MPKDKIIIIIITIITIIIIQLMYTNNALNTIPSAYRLNIHQKMIFYTSRTVLIIHFTGVDPL